MSTCMPMQIPRKGRPVARKRAMAASIPAARRLSIACEKAPTPGRISRSAPAMAATSPVSSGSAPMRVSALHTE